MSFEKSYLKINKKFYVLIILFTLFIANYIYLNQKTIKISILYTSDIQSHFFDIDSNSKVSGLLTLPYILNQYKNFCLFDLGNSISQTSDTVLDNGIYLSSVFSKIGYDAINIGASELSWPVNDFSLISQNINTPFISTNLNIKNSVTKNPFSPYIIKDIDGVKIGIIGLINKESLDFIPYEYKKYYDVLPIFQTLKDYVKNLKYKENVDIIILLSRYDVYDDNTVKKNKNYKIDNISIANEVKGIDMILSVAKSDIKLCKVYISSDKNNSNKTIICNTASRAKYIGKTDLLIRKKNKKIVSFENELIPNKIDLSIMKKDKMFLDFKNHLNKNANSTIGKTRFKLKKEVSGFSNIGMLITDAMKNVTKSDFAIIENRYILGSINIGKITYRQVFDLLPNNCFILTFQISGKHLLGLLNHSIESGNDDFLNISGMFYSYDINRSVYSKINSILMESSGSKFDLDKIYKISILDIMFRENSLLSKTAFDVVRTHYNIRDVLQEYFFTNIPVNDIYKNYNIFFKRVYRNKNENFVYKRNN